MSRNFPRKIRRVVVKVGSSVIATYKMKPRAARLRSLADQICALRQSGLEVVLVSSGAIALGMGELGLLRLPRDLASLQALAATGQAVLMHTYRSLFKKRDTCCAQVLLTWDDFDARQRYNNARHTLKAILARDVIPIVNENDTISTDEIRFGDNDKLSAFVAALVHADLLVILSDVEGLYDLKDREKRIFKEIKEITEEVEGYASDTVKREMSKGGMAAKLQAIKMATQSKVPCVIANAETKDVLSRIVSGERIGTFFLEKEEKLLARKHWISFGAKPKGALFVDRGAKEALFKGGRSLLLPGVVRWEGDFKVDDVLVVYDDSWQEIARGISKYSIADLDRPGEKRGRREIIHCDDLVLSTR